MNLSSCEAAQLRAVRSRLRRRDRFGTLTAEVWKIHAGARDGALRRARSYFGLGRSRGAFDRRFGPRHGAIHEERQVVMKRMKMLVVLGALGGLCGLTGLSAVADDKDKDKKEEKSSADRDFAKKASACGMAEVDLSNLALRRTRDPAVRQFAQQMVNDHTNVNRALLEWANRQQVPLAKSKDEKHQKLFDELSKMDDKKFDRAYMEAMVKDHEEAVKLFETQSKDGKDESLKAWAGKALPALKKHLETARDVCKKTKGEDEKGKDKSDK
jgi:putative membrane protein